MQVSSSSLKNSLDLEKFLLDKFLHLLIFHFSNTWFSKTWYFRTTFWKQGYLIFCVRYTTRYSNSYLQNKEESEPWKFTWNKFYCNGKPKTGVFALNYNSAAVRVMLHWNCINFFWNRYRCPFSLLVDMIAPASNICLKRIHGEW